jgi:lipoyl(octanoyl) transferase
MPPLFSKLLYLDQRAAPARGSWNMAFDEALLRTACFPVLRTYSWLEPSTTFGYFIPYQEALTQTNPNQKMIRRWTGGGIVLHGSDVTWTLVVPEQEVFFRIKPASSYMLLHQYCAELLRISGIDTEQVPEAPTAPKNGLCFAQPAPGDLVFTQKKIVGAGQRRTKQGLLHQASMSGINIPENFPALLAASMTEVVEHWTPDDELLELCGRLEEERYAAPAWTERC